jgi:hypothetical protein
MIRYAWYAAKLITSHKVFCDVNQVEFRAEEKNCKMRVQEASIYRCLWCRKCLWFRCIYDEYAYHPESCKSDTWSDVFDTVLTVCKASLMCSILF